MTTKYNWREVLESLRKDVRPEIKVWLTGNRETNEAYNTALDDILPLIEDAVKDERERCASVIAEKMIDLRNEDGSPVEDSIKKEAVLNVLTTPPHQTN